MGSLHRASRKTQNAPRMQLTMHVRKTRVGKSFGRASADSMHLPNNAFDIQKVSTEIAEKCPPLGFGRKVKDLGFYLSPLIPTTEPYWT